jgi:nucleotide-binding universal stress UspA family protein
MSNKRVLVAVDGSPVSLRALKYAASKYATSKLHVVTVLETIPRMTSVPRAVVAEHQARMAEARLRPARALLERAGVNAEYHVGIGDPGPTIVAFARRMRCGEIVMGSRGLGRMAGLVLGSVVTKVLHLSAVPVIVVK